MTKKIPVLVIVGFLGSGKTSLLNHVLSENKGLKIGVIVNDFGAINIDSMLVARQTDSKLELSNGCICCSADEGGLDDAITQLAHSGSLLDYIVIEASGLAEPHDLVYLLSQSKNKYIELDSVIAVIDSETVIEQSEKHPGFFKQLDIADTVVLNKTDLVTKKQLAKVKGYLHFLNERIRLIETSHGAVDTRLLLNSDVALKRDPSNGDQLNLGNHSQHSHIHDDFDTFEFSTKNPIDPKKFELYMKEGIPKSIYRAKGFVYFGIKGIEQKFIFQLVGARHTLKLDDWRGQSPTTDLVFIGKDIDKISLKSDLNALIDEAPEDISGNLMNIFDYR